VPTSRERRARSGEPSSQRIESFDLTITAPEASKAQITLFQSFLTTERLFGIFNEVRGEARGTTSDGQQDLLRSLLIFAMAGLDASLKQLIRDAIPTLVTVSERSEERLEKFAVGRLEAGRTGLDSQFLVGLLRSPNAHDALVQQFIDDLSRDSLQSIEQLLATCDALGLGGDKTLKQLVLGLREAFRIRNQIIHEMDVNLTARNRNRTSRTRASMLRESNRVLRVAREIVKAVDGLLPEVGDRD
jgi:hypothetical protein